MTNGSSEQPPRAPSKAPPPAPPPAPAERKAGVIAETKTQLGTLKDDAFLNRFGAFVTSVEKSDEWDFAGRDFAVTSLRENPVWRELQKQLKEKLQNQRLKPTEIPEDVEQKFVLQWLDAVFKRMKEIIASYDEWIDSMELTHVPTHIEEVLGNNGNPGPFLEWFERNGGEAYATWKRKKEEALAETEGSRKGALANLEAEQKRLVGDEFKALREEGEEIKKALEAATKEGLPATIERSGQYIALTALAHTAKREIDEGAAKAASLTLFKTKLDMLIAEARRKLGLSKTEAEMEASKAVLNPLDDYASLHEKVLGLPENERNDIVSRAENDPNFDPRAELTRLEARLREIEAAAEAQAQVVTGRETLISRKIFGWFDRIANPTVKKTLYSVILAISSALAAIPFFGKSWKRSFISNDIVARMATTTGDLETANSAHWELKTETILIRQGLSQDTRDKLLDTTVPDFLSGNPQDFTENTSEIPAITRLKVAIQNPGNQVDQKANVRLALAIGSRPKFDIEAPPQPPPAQAETAAETPEQKVATFIDQQIKDLTDDEKAHLSRLSAKDVAANNTVRPADFDQNRWNALVDLLKKNKADEVSDASQSVIAFLKGKIEKNETLTTLA